MPESPPPSEYPSDAILTSAGREVVPEEDVKELILDLDESPFLPNLCPLELNGQETQLVDSSWSHNGDMQGFGPVSRLERRWVLWHEFMKEHDQLDSWLRLAEQAVSSSYPDHVTYVTAKEKLRKIKRLRREAGSRLVQLDSLTRRNRTLTGLFQGAMQARLLASARNCGQRWDCVNAKLECITTRLKLFVSEWEGFEAEREELALWLADLDVRLTHLSGHTCEKLRKLRSFQQSVSVNSDRVNVLLQRGEALIQSSDPTDAQRVESDLLKMLRRCSLVFNNIARTHSRLLSMRLVFEDDLILSQATDSGCPSETLLEEEGALDKANMDIPAFPNHPKDFSQSAYPTRAFSPNQLPPPTSTPSSPNHDHLGLEWDPSVDIGRSVSCDNADSLYFNARTGLRHHTNGVKRWSYFSSLGSESDISNDITNHEADLRMEGWLQHDRTSVFSPIVKQGGGTRLNGDQWTTSTPDGEDVGPISFDHGRVRAWLGGHSPAPSDRSTPCSKAVPTDVECNMDGRHINAPNQLRPPLNTQHPSPDPSLSPTHDLKASPDWMKHQYLTDLQAGEEQPCCEGVERLHSEQSMITSSRTPSSRLYPAILCLLLATALALLACLIWFFLEPPSSFHLALRYVNGPPPT
ncbi:hypothetical protein PBY51_009963 [Eleginops maclovinus]|uniref:Uncharacterized protein n=1 Tax=Eleginops maclovinus TaxID=56733 RepID=A0AAN7XZY2_ELEMC|nr:hypothetical protein PBY51_009963 [Eleginops maclovinus]